MSVSEISGKFGVFFSMCDLVNYAWILSCNYPISSYNANLISYLNLVIIKRKVLLLHLLLILCKTSRLK